MTQHNLKFEFSPKLIILLGAQLIHDKKIALSELVKNAYDADASEVKIAVTDNDITILDNGCGMDLHTIKNIWLKPGVSKKKKQVENNQLTEKYRRLPTGEKGIGRLSSHFLGSKIILFSKKLNSTGVYFEIDWEEIEDADSLNDLDPIEVNETNENLGLLQGHETGTYINIKELKDTWKQDEFEDVIRGLSGLISPFSKEKNFNICFEFNKKILNENLEHIARKIRKKALYHFNVVFENGVIQEFLYKFCPWDSLNKVQARQVTHTDNNEILEKKIGKVKMGELSFDKSKEKISEGIGRVCFEGYIYDFDAKLLREEFATPKAKKEIKDYITESGGIRVYRDDFRVFNYGDEGFDILDLDLKRVNSPSGKISSNQIVASVQLKKGDSNKLIEKTNREGFIHNQEFKQFKGSLENVMSVINLLRMEDKAEIIKVYLNKVDKADIETKINRLRMMIDESVFEGEPKKKILSQFDTFSADFSHLNRVLITASNTGLSLTFIVHELEKIIDQLGHKLETKDYSSAEAIFHHLKNTLDSYKGTIQLDRRTSPFSIHKLVSQAISNFNYRFKTHEIKIIKELDDKLNIICQKGLIIGLINNLFDNATYWLKNYEISDRKILIRSYQKEKFVYVLIADNGKGFNIKFESALEPFISGRPDGTSMGIGLYLAEQIMILHQGSIEMGSWAEEGLPKEFSGGGIIKLKFKGNN